MMHFYQSERRKKRLLAVGFLLLIVLGAVGSVYITRRVNVISTEQRSNASVASSNLDSRFSKLNSQIADLSNAIFTRDIQPAFDRVAQLNPKATQDDVAYKQAQLFCGAKPSASDKSLDNWISWRGCVGAGSIVFANHYALKYLQAGSNEDRKKAATNYYLQTLLLDYATTGPEYPLIAKISFVDPEYTYKLRDTMVATRYLADSSGFYSSLGWGISTGVMPREYCTSLETPFDAGKNCKTINLYDRVRQVSAAVASKIATGYMIHADGSLRTEYWNNAEYWASESAGKPYILVQNTAYNPQNGIGWSDPLGRRTAAGVPLPQGWDPYAFTFVMSGLADAAKLALNEGQQYKFMYDFALKAAGYATAFDLNNSSTDFSILNEYGYPLRALAGWCDGKVSLESRDPLDACTGGTREFYQYSRGRNASADMVGLTYNLGQHYSLLASTRSWGAMPSPFKENATDLYTVFKSTTSKDGKSYVDTSNGGFNEAVLKMYQPKSIKSSCRTSPSETYLYYKNPVTGRVVSNTGETAGELFATLLPGLSFLINQRDQNKAYELLDQYSLLLNGLKTVPLNASDGTCGGGTTFGSSPLARSIGQYNNLLVGRFLFKRYALSEAPVASTSTSQAIGSSVTVPTPYNSVSTLPDKIVWNGWQKISLAGSPIIPSSALPYTTRVVFKTQTNQWYDSITKGTRGWNRITSNYKDFGTTMPYSPAEGLNLTSAGYPGESMPFETRVMYQGFDGKIVEGVTKGSKGWTRTIPSWFKPDAWTPVSVDLTQGAYGIPSEVFPPDGRTAYKSDNNLLIDIWVKGDYLWYRSFTATGRISNWNKVSRNTLNLPKEATGKITSVSEWKDANGKWVQSIALGSDTWFRISK